MDQIVPTRNHISDRFSVCSFTVCAPENRLFEVACATDPRLFHSSHAASRSRKNFFTSRIGGLLRAPRGQTTYLLPPEQLKRFAGARRIYYALGTYAGPAGENARFTISPQALEQVPSISLAADFTGRTLDRNRLCGQGSGDEACYGGVDRTSRSSLVWGGDAALAAQMSAVSRSSPAYAGNGYDDGFDPGLWRNEKSRAYGDGDGADSGAGGADAGAKDAAYDDLAGPYVEDLGLHARWLQSEEQNADDYPDSFDGYVEQEEQAGASGQSWNQPRLLQDADSNYADSDQYSDEYEDGADFDNRGPNQSAGQQRFGAPVCAKKTSASHSDHAEDAPALRARGIKPQLIHQAANQRSTYGTPRAAAKNTARSLQESPSAPALRDESYTEIEVEDAQVPAALTGAQALQQPPTPVALGIPEKFAIVEIVARAESAGARYSAINADNEYNTPSHPAYHRYHIGLSWGLVQFTQRGGALGRVLQACNRRDAAEFSRVFGPDSAELLQVTSAATEDERVAPVAGTVLWEEPWLARFRQAGQVAAFQAAQNEIAITDYFDPQIPLAADLGFNTDRALAMLYDRSVHMGGGGGPAWVLRACGPVRSEADRATALSALGFADLASFQSSVGLRATNRWTARTHAALTAALRRLGTQSPLTVLSLDQMLDALVSAATGRSFQARVVTLRSSSELHDTIYQIP